MTVCHRLNAVTSISKLSIEWGVLEYEGCGLKEDEEDVTQHVGGV